ncbi:hypothetical protein PVT71_10670 [Salipiger sp. H15]|uniref:Secreted protein n=1 Tax=Alloyangia sp. H15 TaxID=3029062 RepID=A0AAU8AED8_9RHOB
MKRLDKIALAALGLTALATLSACGGGKETAATTRPATEAESACLRAIGDAAGTKDIEMTGSGFAEDGGFSVQAGVGADRARWDCVARTDDTTGEVSAVATMAGS